MFEIHFMNSWFSLLATINGWLSTFANRVEKQFVDDAYARFNINLRAGGFVLVPNKQSLVYSIQDIATLQTELIGPDNFGHVVAFRFQCTQHFNEQLQLTSKLASGCVVQAIWDHFPSQASLRPTSIQADRFAWSKDLKSRLHFDYFGGSDIFLGFTRAEDKWLPEQITKLQTQLHACAAAWNKAHNKTMETIDFIGNIYVVSDNEVEVYINLGTASFDVVQTFLSNAILVNLGVQKFSLRGYSMITDSNQNPE